MEEGAILLGFQAGGIIRSQQEHDRGRPRDEEREVYSLLRFLIMVLVSTGVWMVLGLGVGWVLHRVVPAIDLGMATLIAVVALGGSFLWLSRISTLEALYGHDDIDRSDVTGSITPQAASRSAGSKRQRRRS
jgi:hypothetical protein